MATFKIKYLDPNDFFTTKEVIKKFNSVESAVEHAGELANKEGFCEVYEKEYYSEAATDYAWRKVY